MSQRVSEAAVLDAARRFGHNPVGGSVDGMIMCEGRDGSLYYLCDPRDDPDFDGQSTADCFRPWGIY